MRAGGAGGTDGRREVPALGALRRVRPGIIRRSAAPTRCCTGRGIGLACPEKQELCCYIGEEQQVRRAMEELALRVEKEKAGGEEAFTDNVIMYEVLSELKDIAARTASPVPAAAISTPWRVRRGAVELICGDCGGRLRLNAATDRDLDDLCCQMS